MAENQKKSSPVFFGSQSTSHVKSMAVVLLHITFAIMQLTASKDAAEQCAWTIVMSQNYTIEKLVALSLMATTASVKTKHHYNANKTLKKCKEKLKESTV